MKREVVGSLLSPTPLSFSYSYLSSTLVYLVLSLSLVCRVRPLVLPAHLVCRHKLSVRGHARRKHRLRLSTKASKTQDKQRVRKTDKLTSS
jgi:hypothetical protein